jgi:hypothetical protein
MGHLHNDRSYDSMLEPQSQNPYDEEYDDYPQYGDGRTAWDNYDNGNYDYHVGYN